MLGIRDCIVRVFVAAGLSLPVVMVVPPFQASAASLDGNWSVLVITEKGKCDRGFRYSVAVANGRVIYRGDTAVNLSGTVAPNGTVKVSIEFGGHGASGIGRLSGKTGTGNWRGTGSSGDCAGRWEAERR